MFGQTAALKRRIESLEEARSSQSQTNGDIYGFLIKNAELVQKLAAAQMKLVSR